MMDTPETFVFTALPREILVDLLLSVPTSSIINLYSDNSTHLKLFDEQHGLWELLYRKIFFWSALGNLQDFLRFFS